jgi:hypothetical protein
LPAYARAIGDVDQADSNHAFSRISELQRAVHSKRKPEVKRPFLRLNRYA